MSLLSDSVRNRLIKLEIVLTAATFALGIYAVVAGVLGENVPIWPIWITKSTTGYLFVNIGMTLFTLSVFALVMLYCKLKRFL